MLLEYLRFMYEWDKDDKAMETYWQYCTVISKMTKELTTSQESFNLAINTTIKQFQKLKLILEDCVKVTQASLAWGKHG